MTPVETARLSRRRSLRPVLISEAFAQTANAAPTAATDTIIQLVPIVAMIAIVYFVLWRPSSVAPKSNANLCRRPSAVTSW